MHKKLLAEAQEALEQRRNEETMLRLFVDDVMDDYEGCELSEEELHQAARDRMKADREVSDDPYFYLDEINFW